MSSDHTNRSKQNFSVRPLTTAEQVAEHCALMIVDGRLDAGERMGEERLAEMCGVSRGPVREALRILEKRRLIEIIPRRGAFVRTVNLDTIADLFNVRNALIALAASTTTTRYINGQAAEGFERLQLCVDELEAMVNDPTQQSLDFAYQIARAVLTIIQASGNALLSDLWQELNENTFWTTIWKVPQIGVTQAERKAILTDFKEILIEMQQGNAAQAESKMRANLDRGRDIVLQNLQTSRPSGIR